MRRGKARRMYVAREQGEEGVRSVTSILHPRDMVETVLVLLSACPVRPEGELHQLLLAGLNRPGNLGCLQGIFLLDGVTDDTLRLLPPSQRHLGVLLRQRRRGFLRFGGRRERALPVSHRVERS